MKPKSKIKNTLPYYLCQNFYSMKKIGLLIGLAIVGAVAYYLLYSKKNKPGEELPKQQAVVVSKYSDAFNGSVNRALNNYYALSEAFVKWDSSGIRTNSTNLINSIDSIQFAEIQKDTIIYETATSYVSGLKSDLETISQQQDITAKRKALHSFSQNFYDLLRTIKYDGGTVFLQECPMAFNDTEQGLWLSNKADIRNPYLGLHHPKYKSGMLECGATKDSLAFRTEATN